MLCQIGQVEVWRILEMNGPFCEARDLYPNAEPNLHEVIDRHAPGQLCPETGRMILPVQGFLLKTPHHVVLVDSCVGNHKTASFPDWNQRDDDRFLIALAASGVGVEDVDYVLCTHLHVDHVGWNTQLLDGRWVPTFPNARYILPEADDAEFAGSDFAHYTESVLPVIETAQAEFVQAGHKLGEEISLVPTPGHTAGHVSIAIKSGGREAVITGDALHSTAQCACPHWHFKFDSDPEQAVRSRRTLLELAAEADMRVLGSHFTLPSIGRVRASGDAFDWVAD